MWINLNRSYRLSCWFVSIFFLFCFQLSLSAFCNNVIQSQCCTVEFNHPNDLPCTLNMLAMWMYMQTKCKNKKQKKKQNKRSQHHPTFDAVFNNVLFIQEICMDVNIDKKHISSNQSAFSFFFLFVMLKWIQPQIQLHTLKHFISTQFVEKSWKRQTSRNRIFILRIIIIKKKTVY